jgi:hypothetical protein
LNSFADTDRDHAGGKPYARAKNQLYKNILTPTDGSELANKAGEHGVHLAKEIGASSR